MSIRKCIYCSNSKSPASAACLPLIGALDANMYSALAPNRFTVQLSLYLLMLCSTPSAQRFPSFIIRSKFSAVKTLLKVARIAASDNAFAARVPPTPPVSITSSSTKFLIESATCFCMPNAPVGKPPPMALPMVRKSGHRPNWAVIPPGPTEIVWVSSIISKASYFLASFSTSFKYPSAGKTMPTLVIAGSIKIAATSLLASAFFIPAKSLNATTRVVKSRSTGAPILPSLATVLPFLSKVAKLSSTLPW